jgi:hypothetical protein
MRVGEVQWRDVDESSATIHVRRSIDRGQLDTTETNTKRAPLAPMAA